MKTKPRWFWYQVVGSLLAVLPALACFVASIYILEESELETPFLAYLTVSVVTLLTGYSMARQGERQEEDERLRKLIREVLQEEGAIKRPSPFYVPPPTPALISAGQLSAEKKTPTSPAATPPAIPSTNGQNGKTSSVVEADVD